MKSAMEKTDKAVSTEDLCIEVSRNASLEAARLEAILNTLVENKVETLKNTKSTTSSPKHLINKLRGASTSTVSSKDKEDSSHSQKVGRKYKRNSSSSRDQNKKPDHKSASSSPKSIKIQDPNINNSEEGASNFNILQRNNINQQQCAILQCSQNCCCKNGTNGEIRMHFDEDYISLKIEDYDDIEIDGLAAQRALKRAQRRKRRRRKRRMKKHLAAVSAMPLPSVNDNFKVLDPDELSQRARFTIVVTACLLLFMCLLLVGITLRMAPIIDDMVRKENEELMNSLARDSKIHSLYNSTASVPFNLT